MESIFNAIKEELETIWHAHARVGLQGYMRLYTELQQDPWRSAEGGLEHWFDAKDIDGAVAYIRQHYNNGKLPNSPVLLDPLVWPSPGRNVRPLGSGIIWSTALGLGVEQLIDEQQTRMDMLSVHYSPFQRGQNARAGLKVIGFSNKILLPLADGKTVQGCKELFEIVGTTGDIYYPYYLLSGLSYLSKHGAFEHPAFASLFSGGLPNRSEMSANAVDAQHLSDAAFCWQKYDHHHSLFVKFGIDPQKVERNLRYYYLCARDIQLFDATGPMRVGAEEQFEFIVPGYIPRGSVTLVAASGGTGKSSVAHHLAVLASSDFPEDVTPRWLGQPLNKELCKGISVYFSGEDGPAIVNARSALFDPEGRSKRLMFQRTDFGEGVTFAQFLKRLEKMPDVPLVVIDPARKYLTGDEEDSHVVSDFFEAIEEFAINKKAAVLVVHHLRKGANPTSTRQVLDELRGSQVFIDRPRVVLGMFREGMHTIVGLAKNNIPPNLGMVQEERVFVRNPENLQLIWLPGPQGVRAQTLSPEELEELEAQSQQSRSA